MIACEYAMWKVLPVIRRRLAVVMVKELGLSQKQVSEKLHISEAAISNYLKGKRGNKKIDGKALKKIRVSAKRIVSGTEINKEICTICKYFLKTENKKVYC